MKSIQQHITERLKLTKDRVNSKYKYFPKNLKELREAIAQIIHDKGNKNADVIDLNIIDTSNVDNMNKLFAYFNREYMNNKYEIDISQWDVSNVKDMSCMFMRSDFNGDISRWNVSHVETMEGMFSFSEFNNDISQWNVLNVKNMNSMFTSSKFNQDISDWNVSHLKSMGAMFYGSKFNQDISQWNISQVENMSNIFAFSDFNKDLTPWADILNKKVDFDDIQKYVK